MKGKGVITSLDGKKAKLKVISDSECMDCSSKKHCFGGNSSKREIVVINEYGAMVSDNVVFEAATGKVILSASLIWIIPIIAMFIGYIVTKRFAGGIWPVGAAFLFLIGFFIILKFIDNAVSGGTTFYPRVIKILYEDKLMNYECQDKE